MKYSDKLLPEIIANGEVAYLRIKKTNAYNEIGFIWTVRYLRKKNKKEIISLWSYKEVIVSRDRDFESACELIYNKLLRRGFITNINK